MSVYRLRRDLDLFTDPYRTETVGVSTEQAFELARVAKNCITLATPDTEPFLRDLPEDATDYHSYDDLTEIIWRTFLSRDDIKDTAKREPQSARSSATYIWRQAILHADRELHNTIHPLFIHRVFDKQVESSTMHRTVISDAAMYDYYTGLKDGTSLSSGIGKRSVSYLEMLLAGTRPELLDIDWPEEVLEFMGGSDREL